MKAKDVSRLFWATKALLVGVLLYFAVAVIVTPLYLGRALKPRSVSGMSVPDIPASVEPPPICPPSWRTIYLAGPSQGLNRSPGHPARMP
jgi:hypothetical protein